MSRGDLEAAESSYSQALTILERLAPDGFAAAATLNHLGVLAIRRGELEAAERYCRRALAIRERISPGSMDVARSLENLGVVVGHMGEPEHQEELFRQALAIQQRLAPGSLEEAHGLHSLAAVACGRGQLDESERLFRRALAIREEEAPGSPAVSSTLIGLAAIATERGELGTAEKLYRRALAIRERLVPGTSELARTLADLGDILWRTGRLEPARQALTRAVVELEAQQGRIGGGSEMRSSYRRAGIAIYRRLMRLLLETGRPEEAFHVLERSRAQDFLAMLAERDLLFTADIPAELDSERRLVAVESDRLLGQLAALSAADDSGGRRAVLDRLREIRSRQAELRDRIRTASPRLAALTYPEPLNLEAAIGILEPGSLVLAFSVDELGAHLFTIPGGSGELEVHALDIDEEGLLELVLRLRALLRDPSSSLEPLRHTACQLGEILLASAAGSIATADRLVILPDGPLHLVPPAALRVPLSGTPDRLLVEATPTSVVLSATVLDQLRRTGGARRPASVVAFGDPVYHRDTESGDPTLDPARRTGLALGQLPASRREVEGLRKVFGEAAQVWLGAQATEERLKAVGTGVSILHVAAHGLLDERLPLDSALALTIPVLGQEARDNGLLQAWEIIEQVRLDADLVTLSACDTALGEVVTGEGIVGLTRAFQYAGARSVLATLWSVADESTAELMRRFYAVLKAGRAKDEALRSAQLDLIRGPIEINGEDGQREQIDASHPYHWAAFVLVGDWQ